MADLAARIEVEKLTAALGVTGDELMFLTASSPDEIRSLTGAVRTAIAERNAGRVQRVAGLTGMVPTSIASKVAQHAFGPRLSARVAAVIEPADAAKLAGHLPAPFLAQVAARLDPERVEGLIRGLPDQLLVDVGRQILADGEHAALGRLVAVVSTEVATRVVENATADELLRVALYADDPAQLEAVIDELSDERLQGVLTAAEQLDPDARGLLESRVSPATRDRLTERL
ncbi:MULTISPECIES: hypothetical protein [Nocardioides]|uniref:Magnesium transporter MgtE intracellular domain-containing protein n=1 Tax=Nocardioides vastitatis TaxID=2568655 RepID=A0ABW0ZM56_9ACTN|nr:hypothetical protein [Nocardioides sp.]THJ01630.1 hypothetical protein E7Z54_11095 [Nocardioides sp.]